MLEVLIQVLIVALVAGVLLWGIQRLPIDATIKEVVRVVVIVILAIWLIMLLASFLPGGPFLPMRR
jgi:hypothetical protein